ncbi:MAG: hypothetical protein QOJ42_7284 [Acidobacteriaceae bacterium]|jgi:hypothetical protein|nr:hypothetical protein [Acidobacteriaceae bacterium]
MAPVSVLLMGLAGTRVVVDRRDTSSQLQSYIFAQALSRPQ